MEGSKKVSIEDVYSALINFNDNLTKKIEGIERELKHLTSKINTEVSEIKEKVSKVELENIQLKARLSVVERKLRNKNLVFYGVQEHQNENDRDILKTVQDLIKNKLEIKDFNISEVSNAFRLGKKLDNGKIRPLLIEFITYFRKKEVISKRTKLKGSKIFINEDLTNEDRKEKNVLIKVAKEVKQHYDITAVIKGKIISINGNTYTVEDIQNRKHLITSYDSPPPPRNAVSEPSTPVASYLLEECMNTELEETVADKGRKLEEAPEKPNEKQKIKNPNANQRTSSRNRTQK